MFVTLILEVSAQMYCKSGCVRDLISTPKHVGRFFWHSTWRTQWKLL